MGHFVVTLALVALTLTCISGYSHLSDPAKRWPGGIVYYKLDDNLGSFIPEIKRAMEHIASHTCVRYVERTDQPNFVYFRQVTDLGCTASFGFQGVGQQNVTVFQPECGFFSYFIHQLIQQLGMHHEHQRSDRDEYIKVNTSNVDPGGIRLFDKLDPSVHTRSQVYDFDSIMHYGSLRFSNNGEPTMLYLNGSRIMELKDKTGLSPLDIEGINSYYNCPEHSSAGHVHLTSALNFVLVALFIVFRL